MEWATIIADASFCPNTGAAGYGFWIASGRGKHAGEGMMKGVVANNIAAEMMALLNALYTAYSNGTIQDNEGVLLQTDCQGAIDAFIDKRVNITTQEKELVNWYKKFTSERRLLIRFKHVKGHTNNSDNRSASNRACDRRARRQMKKARDLLAIKDLRRIVNGS